MKKYLITLLLALTIGFFLANFFIKQYDDYNGIKVSNTGDTLYFVQYGAFSSLESMEENTISLQNYVYSEDENLYYVYVGITSIKENAEKIVEFYKNNGYEAIIKEFEISNTNFLESLKTYDDVLKNTEDETAIASVINQVLMKYEEVVINGG
ncbi:MAG: SPOR domain-containing protein [Bacilli bacterium]|nr:SPOR domain-containing protein [Bacilli bacterium]